MIFSIHAPHEGARPISFVIYIRRFRFQSTLPTRGSDCIRHSNGGRCHFSIHAPHEGERRASALPRLADNGIFNPRSPRGGATLRQYLDLMSFVVFNPRSPRGGATRLRCLCKYHNAFSIHAPHEGERPYYYLNAIFFF